MLLIQLPGSELDGGCMVRAGPVGFACGAQGTHGLRTLR